ncbi:MAG: ABC transporter substrate-binding protein [Marinimicrobia bacterium 46_47]|nr:MAG: ABC transporter substrate-binding protein [Marinimicrobia bacterium 46_47]
MKKTALLLLTLLLGLSLFSCGKSVDKNRVVVAQQFGLGYAPVILMQELNLIEKYYPEAQVEWVRLGSGGAIREGMAGGNIDVGSMGVPPYLNCVAVAGFHPAYSSFHGCGKGTGKSQSSGSEYYCHGPSRRSQCPDQPGGN